MESKRSRISTEKDALRSKVSCASKNERVPPRRRRGAHLEVHIPQFSVPLWLIVSPFQSSSHQSKRFLESSPQVHRPRSMNREKGETDILFISPRNTIGPTRAVHTHAAGPVWNEYSGSLRDSQFYSNASRPRDNGKHG